MKPDHRQQQANCATWLGFFTDLATRGVPTMAQLEAITTPDVRFRDPFNDLQGRQALLALLEHTRSQISEVRFKVIDSAVSGQRVYLQWEMTGRVRLLGDWRVRGMSELQFDEAGKLSLHQDYWDAAEQFYAHLPVIGWLIRRVRSRLSIS